MYVNYHAKCHFCKSVSTFCFYSYAIRQNYILVESSTKGQKLTRTEEEIIWMVSIYSLTSKI